MAALKSKAMLSIFAFFQEFVVEIGLVMSCVFDSITVSMIRNRLARKVAPVSVASPMPSAKIGGFTSVAPHENSTLTSIPSCLK